MIGLGQDGHIAPLAARLSSDVDFVVNGALRADGGCEVMTLPGTILGERTHLACLAFSPVDWLERSEVEAGDGAPASGETTGSTGLA